MKKPWNKDIQSRLKDFQTKAPEGLLDDIKSEMSRRGLPFEPTQAKPQRMIPSAFRHIASVAAVIAMLFGISHLFLREEAALLLPEAESNNPIATDDFSTLPTEEVEVTGSHPAAIPHTKRLVAKSIAATDTLTDYSQKETTLEEETATEENADTIARQAPAPQKKAEPTPKQKQWSFTTPRKQRTSLDVGIYYSGLMAQISTGEKRIMMPSPPSDNLTPPDGENAGGSINQPDSGDYETDSTSTDSRSFNRVASRSFSRKEDKEKAKHHLPVRFGISLQYKLNEQWNIQSGLTYSYLASDLSYNGATPYETKQKLHYIGIPLQIGYRIWESKNFRGYISAGGQVEKLVSGKATTHYTTETQQQGTLTENIDDNRLWFSALASIGTEYALNKNFSLYAEPGIHYYFKNGSELQTYYKEHPLNFSLTLGLRFHWRK